MLTSCLRKSCSPSWWAALPWCRRTPSACACCTIFPLPRPCWTRCRREYSCGTRSSQGRPTQQVTLIKFRFPFPWNCQLKTDGKSLLSLFLVKSYKKRKYDVWKNAFFTKNLQTNDNIYSIPLNSFIPWLISPLQ